MRSGAWEKSFKNQQFENHQHCLFTQLSSKGKPKSLCVRFISADKRHSSLQLAIGFAGEKEECITAMNNIRNQIPGIKENAEGVLLLSIENIESKTFIETMDKLFILLSKTDPDEQEYISFACIEMLCFLQYPFDGKIPVWQYHFDQENYPFALQILQKLQSHNHHQYLVSLCLDLHDKLDTGKFVGAFQYVDLVEWYRAINVEKYIYIEKADAILAGLLQQKDLTQDQRLKYMQLAFGTENQKVRGMAMDQLAHAKPGTFQGVKIDEDTIINGAIYMSELNDQLARFKEENRQMKQRLQKQGFLSETPFKDVTNKKEVKQENTEIKTSISNTCSIQ